jgi:hypothetical protein
MLHPKLRANLEFIIGCEPSIADQLSLDNVVITHTREISKEPDFQYKLMNNKHNPFINSWSHFVDENSIAKILEYPYALRVDVDTFLSPAILDIKFEESEVFTGPGGYIGSQITIDNLIRVSKALDMRHRGIHNIGSTWYTRSENMIDIGRISIDCAQHFLHNEFSEEGEWPEWYAPVTTMYAGEIALNHLDFRVSICDKLDVSSTSDNSLSDVYSIHCWHTDEFFSKHRYANGEYDALPTPGRIEYCKDYAFFCMRMAELQPGRIANSDMPVYLTPIQGIRAAINLLIQAIPKTPKYIWLKLTKKFRRIE